MPLPPYLKESCQGVTLAIKVQPRAPRNQLADIAGPELKIKVAAPPVDSAANEALLDFLAEVLECPRRAVQLLRGHTARHKLVRVTGMTAQQVQARLAMAG